MNPDDQLERQYEETVRSYDLPDLQRELSFAEGFGAYDRLSEAWLNACRIEAMRRGLR